LPSRSSRTPPPCTRDIHDALEEKLRSTKKELVKSQADCAKLQEEIRALKKEALVGHLLPPPPHTHAP